MTESVPADSREAFAAMLDDLDADNGAGPEAQRAAQYAVATSDPEYLSAVRAVIRDPRRGTLRWTDAQRAAFDRVETVAARLGIAETEYASRAMSLSPGTAGGLLVPFTLDPTIAISNSGSANPYRRLATIKQTTTNAFNGVSSPGVNAAWVAEGVASTDNSPTLAAITIPNFKGTAWCFGSYELIGDSNFGEQLPRLLADAKDRLEENAFTLGNGTSQAKGIITAATTLVQTATAGTFVFGDIYKIWEQVPPRFRVADSARPAWVTTLVNLDRMRQMPPATGFLTSIVNDLTSDQIPEVLGTDIYESTSMVSTLTAGSKIAVVGSWDNYWIADRLGSSIIYEPIITATADSRMPIGSAGWYLFWRTGADAAVPGAFRTLTT
jgi:HK97 family phage major capsid protein